MLLPPRREDLTFSTRVLGVNDPENWRWIWMVAVGFFAVGEMMLAGSFFMLPFAAGALVACIAAFAGASIAVQWLLFVAVSAVASAAIIPLRRRLDQGEPLEGVGARRLMNLEGVVIDAVPAGPGATGMVRLGREEWRAESHDQGPLAPGTVVRVTDVRGTSVIVKAEAFRPSPAQGATP
jgi:membrane protein implicated in regulation of membrane protease activity